MVGAHRHRWGTPRAIAHQAGHDLCEPGLVKSPDGKTWALLMRENSRQHNGSVIFSTDAGRTWSDPQPLPPALTGDRHTARYDQDGHLVICFRDTTRQSVTQGDWVAWIGAWNDIVQGTEGRCRVRLMDNHHRWDCKPLKDPPTDCVSVNVSLSGRRTVARRPHPQRDLRPLDPRRIAVDRRGALPRERDAQTTWGLINQTKTY